MHVLYKCVIYIGCVSWVAMYPPAGLPKDMVEPTIGGSDYWANKVRMQYRKTNPEQVSFGKKKGGEGGEGCISHGLVDKEK